MKNLFSLNIYLDALKRIKVVSIVFLAITVMGSVAGGLTYLLPYLYQPTYQSSTEIQVLSLLDLTSGAAGYVTMLAPVVMIVSMSYLFKRNESDFYESLPYSRGQMLVSSALAVMSVSVVTILIFSGIGVAIILPCIGKTVEYRLLKGLLELLGLILCASVSVCAASFAVSVTGTAVNSAVVCFLLTFVPRFILLLINSSVEALCPTLMSGHIIPLFDNGYNMLAAMMLGSHKVFTSPQAYIYTVLLGVAYATVAYILFVRRKSEFATHSFAYKIFRHIFAVLFALFIVTFGIYLIAIDAWLTVFALFVFAFAIGVYFAYSLVSGKKDGALSSLKAFPILVGASAVVALTVFLSANLFNSYSPSAEEIKSVSVFAPETDEWYNYIEYSDYVSKRAENITLTDTESKEIIERAIKRADDIDSHASYVAVSFKINTWYNSYRTLNLTSEEYTKIITKLAENEEYKALWLNVKDGAINPSVSDDVTVEGEDAELILSALAEEVAECGFDKWLSVYTSGDVGARLQYYTELGGRTYIVSLPITEEMPRSYSLYLEKRKVAAENLVLDMKETIASCVEGATEELYVCFNFTDEDNTSYWIEDDLTPGETDMEALFLEIFGLLSTDYVSYDDVTVYVSIYSNSSFSDYYYYSFKVPSENMEKINDIFNKYGESYRDLAE